MDEGDHDESWDPAFDGMESVRCVGHGLSLLGHGGGKPGGNLESAGMA